MLRPQRWPGYSRSRRLGAHGTRDRVTVAGLIREGDGRTCGGTLADGLQTLSHGDSDGTSIETAALACT